MNFWDWDLLLLSHLNLHLPIQANFKIKLQKLWSKNHHISINMVVVVVIQSHVVIKEQVFKEREPLKA
jgi:hypothetical protein